MYLVRSEVPKHTTSFFSGIFKLSSGDLATVASCFPTQQNQSLLLLIHFLTLAADCKIFPNTAESTVIPSSFILLTLSSSQIPVLLSGHRNLYGVSEDYTTLVVYHWVAPSLFATHQLHTMGRTNRPNQIGQRFIS
jgi:hypothetical protein